MSQQLLDAFYKLIPEEKGILFDKIACGRTRHITVLLEDIFQEHNASAVVRTCDCFGIQDVHVIEDRNRYKVQREIARGSDKWVDIHNYNLGDSPLKDAITLLKNKGYKIAALTPDAPKTIYDIPIDQPIALSFGTEWEGISEELRKLADYQIAIPMYGFTESFNVSVSVALTLQALRKRLEDSTYDWLLSNKDEIDIKLKWCQRYMKNGNVVRKELEKRLLESK